VAIHIGLRSALEYKRKHVIRKGKKERALDPLGVFGKSFVWIYHNTTDNYVYERIELYQRYESINEG